MKRVTAKARAAVGLYRDGPVGIQGDWNASCMAAGYTEEQRIEGALRTVFEQEGLPVPQRLSVPVAANVVDVVAPPADAPQAEWRALAERLRPTWIAIANGSQEVTSQQRQVIQDIMNRGFGRAGTTGDAPPADLRVVLLPQIGVDSEARVCPRCQATFT